MLLKREFTFDAAHNLAEYHGKCERLHGHTYRLEVVLSGTPDGEGMIRDFACVKEVVNDRVLSLLDHAYLNDIIPQPSAENIAAYAFKALDPHLRGPNYELCEVCVWESPGSSVVFGRDDLRACGEGRG